LISENQQNRKAPPPGRFFLPVKKVRLQTPTRTFVAGISVSCFFIVTMLDRYFNNAEA